MNEGVVFIRVCQVLEIMYLTPIMYPIACALLLALPLSSTTRVLFHWIVRHLDRLHRKDSD